MLMEGFKIQASDCKQRCDEEDNLVTLSISNMSYVTPEQIFQLQKPTEGKACLQRHLSLKPLPISCKGFLCPLSANTFGIDFLQFSIIDYQTKKIIFEVGKDSPTPQDIAVDFSNLGEDMYRKIKYTFSEDVLRLPLIQTT